MSSAAPPTIIIELFGVPRMKAGCARVTVNAETLGVALAGLAARRPALAGTVVRDDGRLHSAYRVSLNGDRFLVDPASVLTTNDVLLLLAADVGG